MAKVIEGSIAEGGRIVDDAWVVVDTVDALDAVASDASIIASHALWTTARDRLIARTAPLGIRLDAPDDPASIADDLARFALIAIDFPKFTDGRGYTIARMLRVRYGYTGSLRAVGDVLRDQLFYLLRCGFDSFVPKHEDRIDDALNAYRDFTVSYQTSVECKRPLFAVRAGAAA